MLIFRKILLTLFYHSEATTRSILLKKGVLKNFAKFTGKHLCLSLFLDKVAGLRHGCFSHFLNCTNGTKSRKVSHLYIVFIVHQSSLKYLLHTLSLL